MAEIGNAVTPTLATSAQVKHVIQTCKELNGRLAEINLLFTMSSHSASSIGPFVKFISARGRFRSGPNFEFYYRDTHKAPRKVLEPAILQDLVVQIVANSGSEVPGKGTDEDLARYKEQMEAMKVFRECHTLGLKIHKTYDMLRQFGAFVPCTYGIP